MPPSDPLPFTYTVTRKSIKHLYLRIREGKVSVSANKQVSQADIEQFVRSKSSWIQKQLTHTSKQNNLTDSTATVYLLGKAYPVQIHTDQYSKKESMEIKNQTAHFILNTQAEHWILQSLRDNYYKDLCNTVITSIVNSYAGKMQCYPTKLSYRHNKTRWGSCSSRNTLSLNTRLMMLPKAMITYVVIHELAHIRHKNHSSAFWEFVAQYCPDYKALRRNLRVFESFL